MLSWIRITGPYDFFRIIYLREAVKKQRKKLNWHFFLIYPSTPNPNPISEKKNGEIGTQSRNPQSLKE